MTGNGQNDEWDGVSHKDTIYMQNKNISLWSIREKENVILLKEV